MISHNLSCYGQFQPGAYKFNDEMRKNLTICETVARTIASDNTAERVNVQNISANSGPRYILIVQEYRPSLLERCMYLFPSRQVVNNNIVNNNVYVNSDRKEEDKKDNTTLKIIAGVIALVVGIIFAYKSGGSYAKHEQNEDAALVLNEQLGNITRLKGELADYERAGYRFGNDVLTDISVISGSVDGIKRILDSERTRHFNKLVAQVTIAASCALFITGLVANISALTAVATLTTLVAGGYLVFRAGYDGVVKTRIQTQAQHLADKFVEMRSKVWQNAPQFSSPAADAYVADIERRNLAQNMHQSASPYSQVGYASSVDENYGDEGVVSAPGGVRPQQNDPRPPSFNPNNTAWV